MYPAHNQPLFFQTIPDALKFSLFDFFRMMAIPLACHPVSDFVLGQLLAAWHHEYLNQIGKFRRTIVITSNINMHAVVDRPVINEYTLNQKRYFFHQDFLLLESE